MTVTRNSTGRDDGIDSSNLDRTTAHAPEGIDIAEVQAEQDCQQRLLEVCHRRDLMEPCTEMPKPKEEGKNRTTKA